MMDKEFIFGCIAFVIIQYLQEASCITCFHCNGAEHMHDCVLGDHVRLCMPNQACFMEKRINLQTGNTQYYAGCMNIKLCVLDLCQKMFYGDAHSRSVIDSLQLPVCTQCCYENNCNIELCGEKINVLSDVTQCYNCKGMVDASVCSQTIECDLRIMSCYVQKNTVGSFNLGCINARQCGLLVHSAVDVSNETRCCQTPMCNGNPKIPKLDNLESIFKNLSCPHLVKTTTTTTVKPTVTTTTVKTTPTTTVKPTVTTTSVTTTPTTTTVKPTVTTTSVKTTPITTTVKTTVTTTTVKTTHTTTTVKPTVTTTSVKTTPTTATFNIMPTSPPVETASTTKIDTFSPTHTTVKTSHTPPTLTTHMTYTPTHPTTGTLDTISTKTASTLLCDSNVISNCTFDDGVLCGWTQANNENFDWTLQSGPTITDDTGPDNDHTLGSGQGKYLYVESSAPRSFGEYASLISPVMLAGDTTILQFWYFMYGAGIGSLVVNLTDQSSNQVELLKIAGDHGQKWINAKISIPGWKVPNDYRITITAFVGSSYTGDIAIDDLVISKNSCKGQALSTIYADVTSPPHLFQTTPTNFVPVSTSIPRTTPIATTHQFTDVTSSSATTMPELCDHFLRKGVVNCTFDSGICFWAQQRNDNFDWTLQSGAMLIDHAGPIHDHTLGTGLGKYLYIKPSASRLHNEYTNMISPVFHYSHALYFEFWYYMPGSGRLFVYLKDKMSQQEVELLAIEGNQIEKWTKASITFNAQQDIPPELNDYMLVITVHVGQDYGGGIAIDDLVIIEGTCDGNVGGSLIIG